MSISIHGGPLQFLATDPVLHYSPSVDASDSSGWTTDYTKGYYKVMYPAGAQAGGGDPYRFATTVGSSVTCDFFGTTVSASGTSSGEVTITLDGESKTASASAGDLIFETTNLSQSWHALTISLTGGATPLLNISTVDFDTGLHKVFKVGNIWGYNESRWNLGDGWYQEVFPTGRGNAGMRRGISATKPNTNLTIEFAPDIPSHSQKLVFIYGNLDSGHGRYDVSTISGGTYRASRGGTGESKYAVSDALLWFDVTDSYDAVSVRNAEAKNLTIFTFRYDIPDDPLPTREIRAVHYLKIVGGVFAGVVVLALILAVFNYYRRRRAVSAPGQMAGGQWNVPGTAAGPGNVQWSHNGNAAEGVEVQYLATDPVLHYAPTVDGSDGSGWVTNYTKGLSAASYPVGAMTGEGDAYRVATVVGSSVTCDFYGTAVSASGKSSGDVTVTLDGKRTAASATAGKHIFEATKLSQSWHSLTINLTGGANAFLHIDSVDFDTGLPGTFKSGRISADNSSRWQAGDGWSMKLLRTPYGWMKSGLSASKPGTNASIVFAPDIPLSSQSVVYLYGNLDASHGRYDVSTSSGGTYRSSRGGTSYSKYAVAQALLWFGVTDSSDGLAVRSAEAKNLTLWSMEFYIGNEVLFYLQIAGYIVAGLLLAAITLAIRKCLRRRR
ncbi:hypothetical protein BKA62DRAFT_792945 [Auriculariales sp. MPI-PUGE-AT-0066]|nr:hypothetical protein BKA62DRAFT_792945 [Auriculariales sp. MPI-PUGE-AT-0066]